MSKSSRQIAQTWPYTRHQELEKQLQQAASTWFASRQCKVSPKHAYLLAKHSDWHQNIILPEVAETIEEQRALRKSQKGFALHSYLHHGLSSQAMVFNLIGPLISRQDLACLQNALTEMKVPWPSGAITAAYELVNRDVFNEDRGQPTSIDLVLGGEVGPTLFIEAKLVEKEFGGCSVFEGGDCDGQNPASDHSLCYLHHIDRRYWTRLDEYGFLNGAFKDSPVCLLTLYYQFFREVLFALVNDGCFVLLVDERNPVFHRDGEPGVRGLMPFLTQFVPEQHRSRVHRITIQQVVTAIEQSGRHTDWIGEFKRKYGMKDG